MNKQMSSKPMGKLMEENQAAKFLRVSRMTLLRARMKGRVRFYWIGTRVLYEQAQLEEFLQLYCDSTARPNHKLRERIAAKRATA